MNRVYTPFLIQIDLRANLEDCPDVIALIKRKLLRSAFDGKDGAMRLTFVKEEAGTAHSIMEKYRAIWEHPDVTNMRVLSTNPNNASSSGPGDPVGVKLESMWLKNGKRRKAENMANADRALVKQMKGAGGQPIMGSRRGRKASAKPNKNELHRQANNLFATAGKQSNSDT
ncbi:hypothetical protein GCM10007853_08050 [Algimonas ampicilliniresistens]|uniref:Uncharacterized protein n=1 Tax=Algimonas ampicilliniresistens TaxID=1298735 RepID=A0ABQ5V5X3_9PROT|nr:hypothetical protein [Algimonas ampicilliniresistens]GLQ22931.1 hypothetical protein GCM10007853_08050 [Algimonas ampicilliniresistens]